MPKLFSVTTTAPGSSLLGAAGFSATKSRVIRFTPEEGMVVAGPEEGEEQRFADPSSLVRVLFLANGSLKLTLVPSAAPLSEALSQRNMGGKRVNIVVTLTDDSQLDDFVRAIKDFSPHVALENETARPSRGSSLGSWGAAVLGGGRRSLASSSMDVHAAMLASTSPSPRVSMDDPGIEPDLLGAGGGVGAGLPPPPPFGTATTATATASAASSSSTGTAPPRGSGLLHTPDAANPAAPDGSSDLAQAVNDFEDDVSPADLARPPPPSLLSTLLAGEETADSTGLSLIHI